MTDHVVVIGAGGFGREVLDVLEAMNLAGRDIVITGVVDDNPSRLNLKRLTDRQVRYLGPIETLDTRNYSTTKYLLGIGNPEVRRSIAKVLDNAGLTPFKAVHPCAIVGTRSEIAEGSVICAGVSISTNVSIGRHVHLNPNVTIGHDSILEDFVSINPGAIISGDVVVKATSLVGAGSVVLERRTVGQSTTVGAAALVTKDIPPGVTVKGIPGRWGMRGEQVLDDFDSHKH